MNIYKKIYQFIIPEEYHSYEETNKNKNRRIGFMFFIFIVLVKSILYFLYPGVDKITWGGYLSTVLTESVVIFGAGLLVGLIPYAICLILRRKAETANKTCFIFWALGVLFFIYLNFKVNYPDFFL